MKKRGEIMMQCIFDRCRRRSPALLALGSTVALVLSTACGDDPTGPGVVTADFQAAAASITESEVRGHVSVLSHDSMLGRWSPSPQIEKAASYIAGEFSRAGLRPGTDTGYLQWFEIEALGQVVESDASLARVPGNPGGSGASPNVIGWIQGADPSLRDEHVVFSAHFDHIGTSSVASPTGDYIYNGADDNASGTAALIEIAEAFGSLASPPARSVIFLATSGEERGLLGALHYTTDPTLPIASTLANINLDMIGRNDPATVRAIHRSESDLGELVQSVADLHQDIGVTPIDVTDNTLVQRSDCWAFITRGVDALFLHSGLHEDYHGLDDEVERLDSEKAAAVARLAWWVGLELVR
ncbi:MAG: M28 family peptidase [Gemmatimonadota bacterium]